MRLSDRDIHNYIVDGELVIVGTSKNFPFSREQVQPSSIDLRLGNRFLKFKEEVRQFDVKDLDKVWDYLEIMEYEEGDKIIISPHEILFGQIYEQLRIPSDCSGMVEGRSRFARLGISVHATGGFINPEFEGAMPLQIINNNDIPIVLYPFMNVCQLILVKLSSQTVIPYPKKSDNPYHQEENAGPSVSHTDKAVSGYSEDVPSIKSVTEKRLIDKYLKERERNKLKEELNEEIQKNENSQTIIYQDSRLGVINTGEIHKELEANLNELTHDKKVNESILVMIEELVKKIEENKVIHEKERAETYELIAEITEQLNKKKKGQLKEKVINVLVQRLGALVINNKVVDPEYWSKLSKKIIGVI